MTMKHAVCVVLVSLASTALSWGQSPRTLRYYELLRQRPASGTLFDRLVDAWLEDSTLDSLTAFLAQKTSAAEATAADFRLAALLAGRRSDDTTEMKALDAALRLEPANPGIWLAKAKLQLNQGDYPGAKESASKGLAGTNAGHIELARVKALSLLRQDDRPGALKVLKDLAGQHPDDQNLAEDIVEVLFTEGLLEEAATASKELVAATRDPYAKVTRQLRLSDILARSQKKEEALAVLENVLSAAAQDSWVEGDVLARITSIYRYEDDVQGLSTKLETLTQNHPQRASLAWAWGKVQADLGEGDKALAIFQSVLKSNPGRRDLQEELLDQLVGMNRLNEAIDQARALLALKPQDKEMLFRIAALHHQRKDNTASQQALEEALKLPGTTEGDHLRAARQLDQWLRDEAALQAYERTAQLYPDNDAVKEAFAAFLVAHDRKEQGLKLFRDLAAKGSLEVLLRVGQALQLRSETRAAQDILAAREREFADQPRYLALLVSLALTNKENDTALRLSRARLLLMESFNDTSVAVRQILSALTTPEALTALRKELEDKAQAGTLRIQERCLLAQILETQNKTSAAEQLLNDKAVTRPDEKLMAISQLVAFHSTRQDYPRAIAALRQLFDLPGGRTATTVQKLVQLSRQNGEPAAALALIPEWKRLAPGAIQPWREEASLLNETGKVEESLKGLRAAVRKFDKDSAMASELARACIAAGQAVEGEAIYLRLYERTEDPAERLRYAYLLGESGAGAPVRLKRLISLFEERQRNNRASALPWLALAELHRGTGSEEPRRLCLYEASRLRPQDAGLLKIIARIEEESGLIKEALTTLEAAAKLDTSARTRQEIARLHIENGSSELGFQILADLAGGNQMDARSVEKLADALCAQDQWPQALELLALHLARFPKDYRLQYLHGSILEEQGKHEEAAKAFFAIISNDEELPGAVPFTFPGPTFAATIFSDALPKQTMDWLRLYELRKSAYSRDETRQWARGSPFNGFGRPATRPGTFTGFILQPTDLPAAGAFALVHLLRITHNSAGDLRRQMASRLAQNGVQDAELLLELDFDENNGPVSEELLKRNPGSLVLHVLWAKTLSLPEPDADPDLLWHANLLLRKAGMTEHALVLGIIAATTEPAQHEAWLREILDFGKTAPASSIVGEILDFRLRKCIDLETGELDGLSQGTARELALLLNKCSEKAHDKLVALPFLVALGLRQEALALEEKSMTAAVTDQEPPPLGYRNAPQNPFPNYSPTPLSCPVSTLGIATIHPDVKPDDSSWDVEDATAYVPLIRSVKHPGARIMLEMQYSNHDGPLMAAEIKRRLAQPAPGFEDYRLAGWFAQYHRRWIEAVELMEKAYVLAPGLEDQKKLNAAIAYAAQEADERSRDALRPRTKTAISRMVEHLVLPDEVNSYLEVAELYDLDTEITQLKQASGSAKDLHQLLRQKQPFGAASSPPPAPNPYSQNAARSQSPPRSQSKAAAKTATIEDVEKALANGQRDAALKQLVDLLRSQAADWRRYRAGTPRSGRMVVESWRKGPLRFEPGLLAEAVLNISNTPAPTANDKLILAAVQELTDCNVEARRLYQEVLATQPRDAFVLQRLIMLSAGADTAPGLALLNQVSSTDLAAVIRCTVQDLMGRESLATTEERRYLAHLLARWLNDQADQKKTLPSDVASALREAPEAAQRGKYDEKAETDSDFPDLWTPDKGVAKGRPSPMREPHDALCRAMMRFPETARSGFAPLAGLALHEAGNPAELHDLAVEALKVLASSKTRKENAASSPITVAFENQHRIAAPPPAYLAVRGAADSRGLEETILPLIQAAEGSAAAQDARLYARLFSCPPAEFEQAATAWCSLARRKGSQLSLQGEGGYRSEVLRIWNHRKLVVPLVTLFLPEAAPVPDPFAPSVQLDEDVIRYITQIRDKMGPDALIDSVRKIRDHCAGTDPELRRKRFRESGSSEANSTSKASAKEREALQKCSFYRTWLAKVLTQPNGTCLPALAVAEEDGLTEDGTWLAHQVVATIMNRFNPSNKEVTVQMAEALGFLGDATHFRTYPLSNRPKATWLGTFVRQAAAAKDCPLLQELESNPRRTLGADITRALLKGRQPAISPDDPSRIDLLLSALKDHRAELTALPRSRQTELAALVHELLTGRNDEEMPMPPALRSLLEPVLAAEKEEALKKYDSLLTISPLSVPQDWREPSSIANHLAHLARIDPARAVRLMIHLIPQVSKPRGRQGKITSLDQQPRAQYLIMMSRVPELLAETLRQGQAIGLCASDRWGEDISHQLGNRDTQKTEQKLTRLKAFSVDAAQWVDAPVRDSKQGTISHTLIWRFLARDAEAQGFNPGTPSEIGEIRSALLKDPAGSRSFGGSLVIALLNAGQQRLALINQGNTSLATSEAPVLQWLQVHGRELTQVNPEMAALLLSLLESAAPQGIQSAPAAEVVSVLTPLVQARHAAIDQEVDRWLTASSFDDLNLPPMASPVSALDLVRQLVPVNQARAIAFLRKVTALMAAQENKEQRGRKQRRPAAETLPARWLESTLAIPELNAESRLLRHEHGLDEPVPQSATDGR